MFFLRCSFGKLGDEMNNPGRTIWEFGSVSVNRCVTASAPDLESFDERSEIFETCFTSPMCRTVTRLLEPVNSRNVFAPLRNAHRGFLGTVLYNSVNHRKSW